MTGTLLPDTPLVALLGYTQQIPIKIRKYTALALLLAKRLIACRWGRGWAPKFKEWMREIIYCQEQLHIYNELMPPSSRPRDIGAPLHSYLLTHTATSDTAHVSLTDEGVGDTE